MSDITVAEAIFGFVGWLTSRDEAVTFSRNHEVPPAPGLAVAFLEANGIDQSSLTEPDWADKLVYPD